MIIRSITLYNYRLYEGENTIKFTLSEGKNITLISGENGFGKTSFLHSLLWCLYGRLIAEVESEVRKDILNFGYNSFLKEILNHNALKKLNSIPKERIEYIRKKGYSTDDDDIKSISQYYVRIDFEDVIIPSLPCTTLTVTRLYDIITDKENVDILIDGVRNELTNEIGPEVFINDFILNKDIARFFFFDSEQIVSLAETKTSAEKRRLCSAYNEVLGVRKYEDLRKNLENTRLRFRKRSSDIQGRERLESLIASQIELQQQIEIAKAKLLTLESEITSLREKDNLLQLQLMREGNNATTTEIKRLETLIQATKQKDEEYKKQLRQFLDYAPFAICGNLFSETKTKLEHDHQLIVANNNQQSRNLVVADITTDLLRMLNRIPLESETSMLLKQEIQEILSKYKGEVAIDNSLLVMSDEDYEEFMSVYTNITTTYHSEFERLADDYKKNKLIIERNSRRLSNIQNKERDEVIKDLRIKKNEIENKITQGEHETHQTHENIGTLSQKLATTNKQVSELSKKVCLDNSDIEKDKLAASLIDELSVFLTSLKQDKKYSLERRIKAILNTLMHKEDFIGSVEVVINGDDMDVELYSTSGNLINKDTLSKGEQQLYATSILKALVDESGISFPVFIDSPLQKFDKSHAAKIITEFYPHISKQVVLFPLLKKELTDDEFDEMKPLVNSTYIIKNEYDHSFIEQVHINNYMENN